ncbi:THO complex subunit 3 [Chytridiales sp. JEL 0842]|nr:THO complex subunit 3 [Chytridiales sp. JEL 0842]
MGSGGGGGPALNQSRSYTEKPTTHSSAHSGSTPTLLNATTLTSTSSTPTVSGSTSTLLSSPHSSYWTPTPPDLRRTTSSISMSPSLSSMDRSFSNKIKGFFKSKRSVDYSASSPDLREDADTRSISSRSGSIRSSFTMDKENGGGFGGFMKNVGKMVGGGMRRKRGDSISSVASSTDMSHAQTTLNEPLVFPNSPQQSPEQPLPYIPLPPPPTLGAPSMASSPMLNTPKKNVTASDVSPPVSPVSIGGWSFDLSPRGSFSSATESEPHSSTDDTKMEPATDEMENGKETALESIPAPKEPENTDVDSASTLPTPPNEESTPTIAVYQSHDKDEESSEEVTASERSDDDSDMASDSDWSDVASDTSDSEFTHTTNHQQRPPHPAFHSILHHPPHLNNPSTDTARPLTLPRSFGRSSPLSSPPISASGTNLAPLDSVTPTEFQTLVASGALGAHMVSRTEVGVRRSKSFVERNVLVTPDNIDEVMHSDAENEEEEEKGEVDGDERHESVRAKGLAPLKRRGAKMGSGRRRGRGNTVNNISELARRLSSGEIEVKTVVEDESDHPPETTVTPSSTGSRSASPVKRRMSTKSTRSVKSTKSTKSTRSTKSNRSSKSLKELLESPSLKDNESLPTGVLMDVMEALYDVPDTLATVRQAEERARMIALGVLGGATMKEESVLPEVEEEGPPGDEVLPGAPTDEVLPQVMPIQPVEVEVKVEVERVSAVDETMSESKADEEASVAPIVVIASQKESTAEETEPVSGAIPSATAAEALELNIPPPPQTAPPSATASKTIIPPRTSSKDSTKEAAIPESWNTLTPPSPARDPEGVPQAPPVIVKEGSKKKWGWFSNLLGPKTTTKSGTPNTTTSTTPASPAVGNAGHPTHGVTISPVAVSAENDDDMVYPSSHELDGYPRYSLPLEKSIYALSHLKLAQHRRPLYQQVVISNLMLYILSVHADVTLNRQGPRTRRKKKKKSRANRGPGGRRAKLVNLESGAGGAVGTNPYSPTLTITPLNIPSSHPSATANWNSSSLMGLPSPPPSASPIIPTLSPPAGVPTLPNISLLEFDTNASATNSSSTVNANSSSSTSPTSMHPTSAAGGGSRRGRNMHHFSAIMAHESHHHHASSELPTSDDQRRGSSMEWSGSEVDSEQSGSESGGGVAGRKSKKAGKKEKGSKTMGLFGKSNGVKYSNGAVKDVGVVAPSPVAVEEEDDNIPLGVVMQKTRRGSSSGLNGGRGSSSVELKGHEGDVDQLVWDPTDPDRLATASVDKTVRLWDLRYPSKARHVIKTSGENINICWSPDGRNIAVGNKDDVISFIDPRGGSDSKGEKKYVWHTMAKDVEVNEIRWNYSGDLFFLTTGQGTIQILEFPSFNLVHTIQAHTANCYCIEFDPKGRYMATGSSDALVSLWDLDDLVCVRTFGRLDWPVRTISFSHDGELIASGSEDHLIDISHVESGERVHKIQLNAAVNTVAWHPTKYMLAYAGDETGGRGSEGCVRVFGLFSN